MTSDNPFISASCVGEVCRCGAPAVRKVGEEIPFDDPNPHRHNLTAYVCAQCFANLLGPLAAKQVGLSASPALGEGDAPVAWRFMLDGGWQYSAIDPRPHISGTVQPLYTHPTPSTPAGEELRERLENALACIEKVPGKAHYALLDQAEADIREVLAALQPQAEGKKE